MPLRRAAVRLAAAVITTVGLATAGPAPADAATTTPTPAWVTAALADQYRLGNSLPLRDAPWWGTHNSFNSPKEMGPALSALDANQKVKIVDQLDIGARQLELDVHWVLDLRQPSKGYQPIVCHALSGGTGCTIEKPLAKVLDEVAGWLRDPTHSDQVLLVYLEDDLQNQTGYQTAGRVIADHLGSLVYRPGGGGCTPMPLSLTRDQVLAGGAQVILVGNSCGVGAAGAWTGEVYDWSHQHLESQPRTYSDYPACGSDFTRAQYDSTMVRYFEELGHLSTLSGAGGFPITPPIAAQMQRCGVDLQSLDFLTANDPRLPALVWSWAPNQPSSAGGCTVQGADARWVSGACTDSHRVACRAPGGSWVVPAAAVAEADAAATCASAGATFAVPRTGYQNQLLRAAAGPDPVWLNFSR